MTTHERMVLTQIRMHTTAVFRKKMTAARRASLGRAFAEMSQSDLALAQRKGWDKGLLKLSPKGTYRW